MKKINSKKSYLGNRVPPEFVSVAEPNEELSAMQKKAKNAIFIRIWWGNTRSNVVA